jgi:hypothetical protein
MSVKSYYNCKMIMVNYADLWLVHSHVASFLDGARLELRELKTRFTLLGACTTYSLLRSNLEAGAVEIKNLKHKLDHFSHYTILSPLCEACVSLKDKLFRATKENIELKQEDTYLTARLKKTILSEKMIEDDLSRVEKSATKSIYKLSASFEMCEDKDEKSAPKFITSFTYHKEEATIELIKAHYPSNPKPSFNPKREARKKSPNRERKLLFTCFCDRASHLDEFCFRRKRIERRRVEYARNSYRDEFIDFPPRSYSHVPPGFYSHASTRTSSRVFSQFSYGPNHRSYDFGSRENRFETKHFGYDPCPCRGDLFPRKPDFPAGGLYTHFELRHLNDSRFSRRGSRPT